MLKYCQVPKYDDHDYLKTLITYKIVKKLKFEEDYTELRPKICLLRQSWDFEQNREIQQNCTEQEKFGIYFSMFFDCCCQILISGRETGHGAMPVSKFRIFLIFPYF